MIIDDLTYDDIIYVLEHLHSVCVHAGMRARDAIMHLMKRLQKSPGINALSMVYRQNGMWIF